MRSLPAWRPCPAARSGPRLLLQPDQSGPTVLDGGWWPESVDLSTAVDGVKQALTDRGFNRNPSAEPSEV